MTPETPRVVTATNPRIAVLTGRVTARGTGAPIPNATVTFSLDGDDDVVTDGAGRFRFEAPRPGTYALRAISANGFAPCQAISERMALRFVARPGTEVGGIELELEPLKTCTGTVTRSDKPAPAVLVRCRELHDFWDVDGAEPAVIAEVMSAADGTFTLPCAPRHVIVVANESPRQYIDSGPRCQLAIALGEPPAKGSESRGGAARRTLLGQVTTEGGRGVPQVEVSCATLAQRADFHTNARSDEAGAFRCEVPSGEEAVVGAIGVPSSAQHVPPETDHVTLVVPAPGRLQGRVREFDGRPVPAFTVSADSEGGQDYARSFVSGDGTFELGDVLAGQYQVVAAAPGAPVPPEQAVTVLPGAVSEVTITIPKGLTVRGVVLDAVTHQPIPGARISAPTSGVFEGPVVSPRLVATTDLNGRFTIRRVTLQGEAPLSVTADGYAMWQMSHREVESEDVTIELLPDAADGGAGPEFGGVGFSYGEGLEIGRLVPGGPAERGGVVVGDRLVTVDGALAPRDIEAVISLVRGPVGSMVELGFERQDGGSLDVRLRRERISNP